MTTTERPLVLPGDPISPDLIPSSTSKPLRLGPGLRHVPPSDIVPVVAGQLITNHQKNSMWVEYNNNRYIPTPGDLIIAQILRSGPDLYFTSISPYTPPATLPHLSFESATKKTRPQLAPGALVYARVVLANKHMDPEIECVSQSTGKSDGLGELKGGMVFDVSLQFARRLLMAKSKEEGKVEVLELLGGEGLVFEIAVGRNGKVWVGGEDVKAIVVVGRALRETDEGGLGVEAQRKLVRRLAKGMK
ncbi:exosome non-catalytic core subunit rrp40 [Podospora pseudopauciseta]|uniref:Ribosomal RNA-processing protein 40 n=1 Tax=Podospora pseudopauciseta TaxID=2093780 RepID=A0ABR0I299_9PEZI|nr:exosome non-catalytic core subunit rrp40 [Podospora pseudopauciseta]